MLFFEDVHLDNYPSVPPLYVNKEISFEYAVYTVQLPYAKLGLRI